MSEHSLILNPSPSVLHVTPLSDPRLLPFCPSCHTTLWSWTPALLSFMSHYSLILDPSPSVLHVTPLCDPGPLPFCLSFHTTNPRPLPSYLPCFISLWSQAGIFHSTVSHYPLISDLYLPVLHAAQVCHPRPLGHHVSLQQNLLLFLSCFFLFFCLFNWVFLQSITYIGTSI